MTQNKRKTWPKFSDFPETVFDEDDGVHFPAKPKVLCEKKPEDFLKEFEKLKEDLYYFRYDDRANMNDVRAGYIQFRDDAERYLSVLNDIIIAITKAMKYYNSIVQHGKALATISKKYKLSHKRYEMALLKEGIDPIEPFHMANLMVDAVETKSSELLRRKKALDKVEQEIAITQDMLLKKKSEMERALTHRYSLTESQKRTLLDEKDAILDGIEQWGSISGALAHNRNIKSKASTIQLYTQKFPEFGEAIAVSKALFKDKLDSIMVDRALEGTENPIFGKGEYIGDYKIKDNKLLLELMKAKVPEQYNKKSIETVKNQQVNNMNIISFANVDETEKGFTRDVGVVLDVDDTGRVERITQEKKMVDFYEKKPGAEIIEPDPNEEVEE